jgi:hypothetical protein
VGNFLDYRVQKELQTGSIRKNIVKRRQTVSIIMNSVKRKADNAHGKENGVSEHKRD